jgi:hypothetical protein
MKKSSFESQYSILQPRLDAQFLPNWGGTRGSDSSLTYIITTKIRLSVALRYFAGGSVYHIMLVHGILLQSVYNSIWGVVDAINVTVELKYQVPDHEQQGKLLLAFALEAELASTVLLEQLMVLLCVPSCPPCLSANI